MQLSNYIKIYSSDEDHDYRLLFSTRRMSSILIPGSVLKSIEDGSLDPSDSETLYGLGFLVPGPEEEKKEILGLFSKDHVSREFHAIVVLNLDCNLACRYCYEGTMKGKRYMSRETADDLINFIEKYLAEGKNISIDFYGGEPLLSSDTIKYISAKLKASAGEKGLQFSFGLITNGTLLTKERINDLLPYGLKRAKVTIDGKKENHDISRPFTSGSGSFDIIIRNLKDACGKITIQLGGNYLRDNYRDFPPLLDYLIENNLTNDKISIVKFDAVTKATSRYALPDFRDGSDSINEPWIIESSVWLREEILKRGYATSRMIPSPCSIEAKDDFVVYFDGTLYKCPAFIGLKELEVGDLKTGVKEYRGLYKLDDWRKEGCLECEYLPLCFGGCKFMKFLRDGSLDGVDCKKPYLDATLETHVKQDLKYRLNHGDN